MNEKTTHLVLPQAAVKTENKKNRKRLYICIEKVSAWALPYNFTLTNLVHNYYLSASILQGYCNIREIFR